jgi:LptD protein
LKFIRASCVLFLWLLIFTGITKNIYGYVYISKQVNNTNVQIEQEKPASQKGSIDDSGKVEGIDNIVTTPGFEKDSIKTDSTRQVLVYSNDTLEHEVVYKADSILFDMAKNKILLEGNAEVTYGNINLKALYIEFEIKKSIVTAYGEMDSLNNFVGRPEFSDGNQSFTAHKLSYSFKSQKGKIFQMITDEGEGFIHASEAKKDKNNNLYGKVMKYTTCQYENPHFWIEAKTLKVIPDQLLVCGPTNLVIEGTRTPLVLPFAIFPIKKGQRSGLIFPEFGEAQNYGFGITNGGYYYGNNDFFDLSLTGDVYTTGSWRVRVNSKINKKYKYSGNINLQYGNLRFGDELTKTLEKQQDFRIGLDFSINQKAWPNNTFSANINYVTSTFYQFNNANFNDHLTNTIQSSISYAHIFTKAPLNLRVSANMIQNTVTRDITLKLPEINFGVSRINPFKSRFGGSQKWYEKIGFSYNMNAKNQISAPDSVLFSPAFTNNLRAAVQHNIPISGSFKVFKFFTFTPSANYTENWYAETINKVYDPVYIDDSIVQFYHADTTTGFAAARYFNFSASFNTRLYGKLQFKSGGLKAIRHVMRPTVSFNYKPDFADPKWGYYKTVQIDTSGKTELYSVFPTDIFGAPPVGEFGGITFSLDNTLEIKVFSKKDTVNHTKKVKILESFRIGGAYNFVADSLKLSRISFTGRTTIADKLNITFNGVFDPYVLNSKGQRIDVFEWERNRRLLRFENINFTMGANFRSKTSNQELETPANFRFARIPGEPLLYYDPDIPWDIAVNYVLNIDKGIGANLDTTAFSQSFTLSGNFSLTPKWRVGFTAGYDIMKNVISYATVDVYRDLHCWEMRIRWIPVGVLQSYNFGINVKSSILKDLKIEKKNNPYGSYNYY